MERKILNNISNVLLSPKKEKKFIMDNYSYHVTYDGTLENAIDIIRLFIYLSLWKIIAVKNENV